MKIKLKWVRDGVKDSQEIDVSSSVLDFIFEIEYMQRHYSMGNMYTAEQTKDRLMVELDTLMRDGDTK